MGLSCEKMRKNSKKMENSREKMKETQQKIAKNHVKILTNSFFCAIIPTYLSVDTVRTPTYRGEGLPRARRERKKIWSI